MSVYDDILARCQERMIAQIQKACDRVVLAFLNQHMEPPVYNPDVPFPLKQQLEQRVLDSQADTKPISESTCTQPFVVPVSPRRLSYRPVNQGWRSRGWRRRG